MTHAVLNALAWRRHAPGGNSGGGGEGGVWLGWQDNKADHEKRPFFVVVAVEIIIRIGPRAQEEG